MKSKTLLIVTASVLLAALLVGGVYAAVNFLHGETDELNNSFVADDDHTPEVSETFDGTEKTDVVVTIPKTDYSVYVRAAVVVNWQKVEEGETFIYQVAPVKGTDYSMSNLGSGWFEKDGFFYYEDPVDGDGTDATGILLASCKELKDPPAGYTLHVEVLTQIIQAAGATDGENVPAVTDAWGIEVDSETGNLIDPNA